MATIGFFMAILLCYGRTIQMKLLLIGITLFIWVILVMMDYLAAFSNDTNDIRTCEMFYWHAMNYAFGFIIGLCFVR
jgi:lipid II:glycine glycyltransferase (peptidoglycan interpeptide bridge formation enzyme)